MKINHIAHPFKFTDDKDHIHTIAKKNQKTTIIATVIAGVFSLGIAALPVFYGVCAYYRSQAKKKYTKAPLTKKSPKETIKTDNVFKKAERSTISKKNPNIKPPSAPDSAPEQEHFTTTPRQDTISSKMKEESEVPTSPLPPPKPMPVPAKNLDKANLNIVSPANPSKTTADVPTKKIDVFDMPPKKRTHLKDIPEDLASHLTDEKIFNFIHGEIYRSKAHEGGSSIDNLAALSRYIEIASPFQNTKQVTKMISDCVAIENSHHLHVEKKLDSYQTHLQNVKNFASRMEMKIKSMESGERILMTGGWQNEGGGHAMLYLIEKQPDNRYAFTVINTGAGLSQGHESKQIDGKTKYKPIYRQKDIESQDLDMQFFSDLKNLQIPYEHDRWGEIAPTHYNAIDVYELINKKGGVRDVKFESHTEFITSQRMGSCSWKSAMKLLFLESENTLEYKNFTFDLRSNSIELQLQSLEKKHPDVEHESIEMLNSAVNNFSKFCNKLHKQKVISDSEFNESFLLIARAKQRIEEWNSLVHKPVALTISDVPAFSNVSTSNNLLIDSAVFSAPRMDYINSFENVHLKLLNKDIFTFSNSLRQLNSDLDGLLHTVKQQTDGHNYELATKLIAGMFLSLDRLGLGKNEYWDTVSEGQPPELIEKTMEQFEYLSRQFIMAFSKLPEQQRKTPDQIAVLSYLMAINLKLAGHLDIEHNPLQNNLVIELGHLLEAFDYNFNAIINHVGIRRLFPEAKKFFQELPKKYMPEKPEVIPGDVFTYLDNRTNKFGGNFDVLIQFDDENKISTSKPSSLNSASIAGLEKILTNPTFIEKCTKLWPHLKSANHKEILVQVFKTWNETYSPIPKSYRFIMQQKYSLEYLLSTDVSDVSDKPMRFGLLNLNSSQQITDNLRMNLQINGFKTLAQTKDLKNDFFKKNQLKIEIPDFLSLFQQANATAIGNKPSNWDGGIDWNSKANAAAGAIANQMKRRNAQEIGLAICTPKLRISNVIAYLQNNPEFLLDRNSQLFIYQTLLSAPNLEIMLGEDNGELRLKIATFVREQYELQKTMGNTQLQRYYLWIAERIGEIAPKFLEDLTIDIPSELFAFANGINDQSMEGKNTKALIYQQLVASYYNHKTLTDDQTILLAKAYAYVKAYGYNEDLSHPTITERLYLATDRLFFEIQDRDERFHQNLAEVISREVLGTRVSTWVGASPNFIDTNHHVTININSLSIRVNEMELGGLPREFLIHPNFSAIFNKLSYQTKSPKPGIYEVTVEGPNKSKETYRLFTYHNLVIQKMINGEWCKFVTPMLEGRFGTSLENFWDTPQNEDLKTGYHHWASNEKNRLYVEHKEKRQLTSVIEFTEEKMKKNDSKQKTFFVHDIKRWLKVTDGEIQAHTERKDISDKNNSTAIHFSKFQSSASVYLWGDKSIEFTKLDIQFNLDRGQYRFSEDEQFYLANVQSEPPGLPFLSGFLRLESEKNGVKYLFPSGGFDLAKSSKGPYGKKIFIDPVNSGPKFFEFEVQKGKLVGKTSEARIFLAYLHLGHKNYSEAAALLKQFQSGKPKGYTGDEMELLTRITDNALEDYSPSALAVRLQAAYLQISSLPLNTPDEDKRTLQTKYNSLLDEYYPVSHHTKLHALTPSQEYEMLDFILTPYAANFKAFETLIIPSGVIKERHKQLKAAGGKYAAKHDVARKVKHPEGFAPKGIIPLELTTVGQLLKQFQLTPGDPSSLPFLPSAAMSDKDLEKHIQGLAPPKNATKVEQAEYLRVQASIRADNANKVQKNNFHLSQEQLERVSKQLEKEMIPALENATEKDLEHILKLANTLPENPLDALRFQLNIIGEKKKKLTIDDLLIFYVQKNGGAILEQNPSLNEQQLGELYALITQYLVKTTQCTYLRGLKKACDDAYKSTGTQKEKDLDDLCDRLLQNRMYDPQSNPLALAFEHASGFRLKGSQVNTVNKLAYGNSKGEKNIIDQLIMNSGKTKVLSPLLAYFLSDGKSIPIMVVPDSLYENTLEDSRKISGENLQQEIETVVLKKDSRLDVQGINELINKMEKIKRNRSYFLINSTTLHNLRLNFIEACNELAEIPAGSEPDALLSKRYLKMKELRNLIEAEGILLIDEVDLVLECTKEVNSASGRWNAVTKESTDCFSKVFDAIVARPSLRGPTLREFLKIDKESEIPFDSVKFSKEIQPQLVAMFIELAGFSNLSPQQKDELELYLLSSDEQDKRPDFISQANTETRQLLALGKEMVKVKGLLTSTIDQKCNEHFGLSRESPINMAIPYAQKDQPSEGSEFSSPYETMIYTMFYYTRQGVSAKQLEKAIERLRGEVLNELKSDKTPLHETKGYKKFEALNLLPGRDLFSIQTGELEEAVKAFNSKIENRMRFAKVYAWSEIGTFSERLPSNPQHLVGMTKRVIGFSGTTSNKDTFHKKLVVEPDAAADGLTLNLLYRSNPKVTPFADDKKAFLKSLIEYQACIDAGSWFRGCDARGTAQQILEHLPREKMKGVIYINDIDVPAGTKGQHVILERDRELPRLLSQTNYPKDERFTYYNVTTGVDIPQDDLAKALVTISRNLSLDRLLQAVWRMRGLDRKQKVDFALPIELEGILGEASFEKIEQLVIQNQTANQTKNNLPATKQKILYEVENLVDKVLRSPKVNPKYAAAISREVKDVTAKKTIDNVEVLFGDAEHPVKIATVIQDQLDTALALIEPAYKKFPEFTDMTPLTQLKADMNAVVNYDLLPLTEFKGSKDEGKTLQVNKNLNIDQKAQTKLELKMVTDRNDYRDNVKEPTIWAVDNYYTEAFWRNCGTNQNGLLSINHYLLEYSKNLVDVGIKPDFFSQDITYTKNFAAPEQLKKSLVPFQSGAKPIGISALRRDLQGNLTLVALYPAEAEKMWQILDDQRDYDKDALEAQQEKTKAVSGAIAIEELNLLFKDEGGFINARSFSGITHNELEGLALKKGGADLIRILAGPRYQILHPEEVENLLRKINNRLEDIGLSENWKPHLSYEDANKCFGGNKEMELFLVDPALGIIKTGRKNWTKADRDALENDPKYIELMAQAKYFNGVLNNYTKPERAYLTEWFKKDPDHIEKFFLVNVLAVKPAEQEKYPDSVIQRSFAAARDSAMVA